MKMRFSMKLFRSWKCRIITFNVVLYLICSSISAKEFKLISLDNFGKIDTITFRDESATQKLTIRKFYPNRSFPIPKNKLIHFYGLNPDNGLSSKKPLFKISFHGIDKDIIIFLKRDKINPEKIIYEFVDNDFTSFPLISTLLFNLSENKIIAKIDGNIIKILPHSKKLIQLSKNANGSFSGKAVFANQREDKSINYFYSSHWRIPSGHKTISLIHKNEESGRIELTEILI